MSDLPAIPFRFGDLPEGTVTFLFSDIEGSTQLVYLLDDRFTAVLAEHHRILREAVARGGGKVVRTEGDSFFVAFPRATEAVAAAVEAQRALAQYPWPEGAAVRVRMGLHTGEPEVALDDYVGIAVHRAARIAHVGYGGQVLLSETTTALVQDDLPSGVALLDLGCHLLKDIRRPERICQLAIEGLPAEYPPLKTPGTPPPFVGGVATATPALGAPGPSGVVHNLPAQLSRFVGRERAIAEVAKLLSAARLLTLVGPGGIGKTRLSLQVAANVLTAFIDGVWLVELAPLTDPDLIVHSIASTLGLREIPGVRLLGLISGYLRGKQVLLLLDNCEHLIEACAQLVDQLLHASPHLHIVATSREALGVAGEVVYSVPPLSMPEAQGYSLERLSRYEGIQLFVARASVAEASFLFTEENAPAIAQICRHLDGIPLAIELAASRIRLFTPEQIAERLDHRFRLLAGGGRTATPRQQTLRALIDWSYDLLSDLERAMFRRLSVFAGGWSFEAAEAVCGDFDVLDLLAALVNKSLVVVERRQNENRYGFLETMRQYAREKLDEATEAATSQEHHLRFFLAFVEKAGLELQGADMMPWLDRLELEQDNLRAALEWAAEKDTTAALRIAAALWCFWSRRGSVSEGLGWIKNVLRRAEAVPQAAEDERAYLVAVARALAAEAALEFDHGDSEASNAAAEKSVALARRVNLPRTLALALSVGAKAKLLLGDVEMTRNWAQESYALALEHGFWFELGLALSALHMAADADSLANLRLQQTQALPLLRKGGNPWMLALNTFDTARVSEMSGDFSQAIIDFEEASKGFRRIRDRQYFSATRSMQAHFLRRQGRNEEAAAIYRETIRYWQELGHLSAVAHQLECFAYLAGDQGRLRRAVSLLGAAASLRDARGSPMSSAERNEYDGVMTRLQAQLDSAGFEAAWAEGQALTPEQSIELALSRLPGPPG